MDIKTKFIKEKIDDEIIELEYVSSKENHADIINKTGAKGINNGTFAQENGQRNKITN